MKWYRHRRNFLKKRNKSRDKVYVANIAAKSTSKIEHKKVLKNHAFLFSMYLPSMEEREGTIYIQYVRSSWKHVRCLKRLPLTSSDLWAWYPGLSKDLLPYLRFARPLSPGNKVNQPVFRYYPRVYTRRCERKRGILFADEKRAQKTRTTQSWCSFAVVAAPPRTEEDFCLRFLITRASTRRHCVGRPWQS